MIYGSTCKLTTEIQLTACFFTLNTTGKCQNKTFSCLPYNLLSNNCSPGERGRKWKRKKKIILPRHLLIPHGTWWSAWAGEIKRKRLTRSLQFLKWLMDYCLTLPLALPTNVVAVNERKKRQSLWYCSEAPIWVMVPVAILSNCYFFCEFVLSVIGTSTNFTFLQLDR